MKPIRNTEIRNAKSIVHWAGDPPPGMHWRCKGIGIGGVEAEAVKTVFAKGSLRVQRADKKDASFRYTIVEVKSGMRVCGFTKKEVAIAFVNRLGLGFSEIFEDISSYESPYDSRMNGLLHKVIAVFRRAEMP